MTDHRTGTRDEWLDARLQARPGPAGRNEGDLSWFRRHDQYESSDR